MIAILKLGLVTVLTMCFSGLAYAEGHHEKSTHFNVTPLKEDVSLLRGRGGNILLLDGKQGLVLIDTDYKDMSDALKVVVESHGGLDKVTYVINTHWHGDHSEGNHLLGHHAQIVAHDNVRTRLLTRQEVKMFGMVLEPYPSHALPSMTYDKAMTLHINEQALDIVHFPHGHTDGDSVIFLKPANIVHMGDHFFSSSFPFVDVENGGDVVQMADNVAAILEQLDDETVVIPGHGPVSDKSGLVEYHKMLMGTIAEVKAMLNADMTIEQIQSEGLSLDWEDWANGLLSSEQWVHIIVTSLTQE